MGQDYMQSNLREITTELYQLELLPQKPESDPIIPDDTPEIVIAPEPFVINTKQKLSL